MLAYVFVYILQAIKNASCQNCLLGLFDRTCRVFIYEDPPRSEGLGCPFFLAKMTIFSCFTQIAWIDCRTSFQTWQR